MSLVSVIVPCYNEEEVLPIFYGELTRVVKSMKEDFEVIFVDDGSSDKTLTLIKGFAKTDNRVKYISFSRNFGKEAAMYAGLEKSLGDFVCLMDADLQDPPSLLPEMVKALEEEGYDSVATRRVTRKGEPKLRTFFANNFYRVMNGVSDARMMSGARDYRLMNRKFVNALLSLSEKERFTKGMFGWVGFKTKWIDFDNVERAAGKTKWSFTKLFDYAMGGIVAFSSVPLKLITYFGICLSAVGFISLITSIILRLCGIYVSGWLFVLEAVGLMLGVQNILFGFYGVYLENIYTEVKNRPIYIIGETNTGDMIDNDK
ncbi:MAG: glycosyltransferase family 2 protein [Clostridia bacterium]|nr:glycosyltransferase family 2 protein [Clostridia bacterium]MBR1676528.1 glycosyltransferase family 2 protein [Clostridia bacterium]